MSEPLKMALKSLFIVLDFNNLFKIYRTIFVSDFAARSYQYIVERFLFIFYDFLRLPKISQAIKNRKKKH